MRGVIPFLLVITGIVLAICLFAAGLFISSPVGLVSTNALVVIKGANFRIVGNPEVINPYVI